MLAGADLFHDLGRHLAAATALRELLAAQEEATRATPQRHGRIALRTGLVHLDFRHFLLRQRRHQLLEFFLQLFGHRLGAAALGIGGAAQERAAWPALHRHRAAAFLALDTGLDRL